MGYEYKIIVDLTPNQSLKLQNLILKQPLFSRKPYKENDFIEFRSSDNNNSDWMPNLYLLFETDGIYICNNSIAPIWHDLQLIKDYLESHDLSYRIIDYSD